MDLSLRFLGAAGTVTGSRYLLRCGATHLLIDCGLFQGVKNLRQRNWRPLPFDAARIDAVLLTHAHLDHSGYLPRLLREGFHAPVYCTAATRALAQILLPDSAHLQEEDARRANRYGYSRHHPAEPLYTAQQAQQALALLRPAPYYHSLRIGEARVRFTPAGHILGAACVQIEAGGRVVTFSGDLGRPHDPVMRPPEALTRADYLILESTYGDRLHPQTDVKATLASIINETFARGGLLMIPAFAVGRAQDLLHLLTGLRTEGAIPAVPIYLDSPMAIDVTELFIRFHREHRLSREQCEAMARAVIYVRDQEASRRLGGNRAPKIIIAGAGMLTGGRILHHLRSFGADHRNTLLITGYQAPGTRGAALLAGADTLRIYGEDVPIRCAVAAIDELSAHADYAEISQWLSHFQDAPRTVFLTHGEPAAADHLRGVVQRRFGWNALVPELGQEFALD